MAYRLGAFTGVRFGALAANRFGGLYVGYQEKPSNKNPTGHRFMGPWRAVANVRFGVIGLAEAHK